MTESSKRPRSAYEAIKKWEEEWKPDPLLTAFESPWDSWGPRETTVIALTEAIRDLTLEIRRHRKSR